MFKKMFLVKPKKLKERFENKDSFLHIKIDTQFICWKKNKTYSHGLTLTYYISTLMCNYL